MSNFRKIYDRVIDNPPIFNTLSKFPKIFMSVNLSYIIVQLDNDYAYSFTFIHLIPCPELRGNAPMQVREHSSQNGVRWYMSYTIGRHLVGDIH